MWRCIALEVVEEGDGVAWSGWKIEWGNGLMALVLWVEEWKDMT